MSTVFSLSARPRPSDPAPLPLPSPFPSHTILTPHPFPVHPLPALSYLGHACAVWQDSSGSIDIDECMEILYRRFGKQDLETKVNEFMSMDQPNKGPASKPGVPTSADEGDNTICFKEYIDGLAKTEDKSHVGFSFSKGIVNATHEENRRLIAMLNEK